MFGPPGLYLYFSKAPLKNRKTPLSPNGGVIRRSVAKCNAKCYTLLQNATVPEWHRMRKAYFQGVKNIFPIGTGCALYIGIESNPQRIEKMENVIRVYFVSECCGCDMTFAQSDYGICPDCGEHCEVLSEEVSLDNGEF